MKVKNWLRWLILGGFVTAGSLFSKEANAVNLDGFFVNTPDCSIKVYRKPTGSIDTLKTITDSDGYWAKDTQQFNPEPQLGDTLYVAGQKNGKSAKTIWIRGPPGENKVYDMHLDKHTVNIKNVFDTSGVSKPLYTIYSLEGIDPCTTEIDTGYDQGWTFYYDVHVPFDKANATPGKQGKIDLVKIIGDTTWKTSIPFTVNKTLFDAQPLPSPVYFPEEMFVTDTTDPTISNVKEWENTTQTSDYAVDWTRTDPSDISADSLEYKVNDDAPVKVPVDSVKGNTAYATINTTAQKDDSVHYKVWSVDNSANANVTYWPSAEDYHSFKINGAGAEEPIKLDKREVKISPNPFYSNVNISYPIKNAQLNIYNTAGQLVDKVPVNNYKAKWGKNASKGIYFAKPGELNGEIDVENKVWKMIKL